MYYEVVVSSHRLGHCGAVNQGSLVSFRQIKGGLTKKEAEDFVADKKRQSPVCGRCGRYSGTNYDPNYLRVGKEYAKKKR
jgi:hypothetical protein